MRKFTPQFDRTLSGNSFLMDLRRHQRFPVRFHTAFSGPKLSESVGTVINLSQSGCCLETDCQVYTGIQLALHLEVPDEAPIHIERAEPRTSVRRGIHHHRFTASGTNGPTSCQIETGLRSGSIGPIGIDSFRPIFFLAYPSHLGLVWHVAGGLADLC